MTVVTVMFLMIHLPGLLEKNAPSAIEHGEFITDVLATWVKKGLWRGLSENPQWRGSGETR